MQPEVKWLEFHGGWWRCFEAALGDLAIVAVLYLLMACAAEAWAEASGVARP